MLPKRNKPKVIELFGLPGSGKSFWADKLAEDPDVDLIKWKTGRLEGFSAALKFPLTASVWFWFIVFETLSSRTFSLFRFKISLLLNTLARVKRAYKSKKPIVVLDEGFSQRFLSFAERETNLKEINYFFKVSPKSDFCLIIESQDPQFGRYDKNHSRSKIGEEYLLQWKKTIEINYKIFKTFLQKKDNSYVIEPKTDTKELISIIKRQ